MSHSDVLTQLMPIALDGVYASDIEGEGKSLDIAQLAAESLLNEMYPDTCNYTLTDWERVYGITPGVNDTVQLRKTRVIGKMRAKGGLSRAYFIALAANMGIQITIDEFQPFMAGIGMAGYPIYVPEIWFVWRVNVLDTPEYYFRAGQSAAGERLRWWPAQTELENLFQELKPAHTYVFFDYAEVSGGLPYNGLAIPSTFVMPF